MGDIFKRCNLCVSEGMEITCDVFVLPPRERRVPGVIWKLLKPVYGLADAPRGWYLALDQQMRVMGCENCVYDPAMYHRSPTGGQKMIEGIAVTHVDDILHGGNDAIWKFFVGSSILIPHFSFNLSARTLLMLVSFFLPY